MIFGTAGDVTTKMAGLETMFGMKMMDFGIVMVAGWWLHAKCNI
jgi:hypothetical protein